MSRRSPASAAGRAPSSRPNSTPEIRVPRWASRTPWPIFRPTPRKEERCMFSHCLKRAIFASVGVLFLLSRAPAAEPAQADRILRVAADPNNLPFSNERLEGFENKIVALVARELGATVEYTWHAQRRGFVRQTIKEGNCDLVAGVPKGFDMLLTTRPYYRSTYVAVARASRHLDIRSLDDPRLKQLTIGVQMIGDDFANTPPAHALSERGCIQNVRGFTVYGDYREP